MTISIQVSVNGNYKVPVTVKNGDAEPVTEVISGRGSDVPVVKYVNHYHGPASVTVVTVGPEEPDNG